MNIQDLGQDRFLRKDPNQSDQTKGAVYAAANPAPKRGDDSLRKIGRPKGSEEDDGAPNVLTGTVITSCFIQTSALPSRIELEGNDITFFDDTYSQNGRIIGDTSRLIFTHGSATRTGEIASGFILQKRALVGDSYDNVLELFSPDNAPNTNFVFIGRKGTGDERNISDIEIAPDHRTSVGDAEGYVNGIFRVRVSRDGVDTDYRDGLYVFDRGTESSTREGTVNWLVAAGEGGQVRLSYMPDRDGNPLNDSTYDIYISSTGINFFVSGVAVLTLDTGGITYTGDIDAVNITASGVLQGASVKLAAGPTWTSGTGSPEGVVTAPIGSLYSNRSGGASTTLYVKTSGAGNTGWTAK
jgi:hypothetical protein